MNGLQEKPFGHSQYFASFSGPSQRHEQYTASLSGRLLHWPKTRARTMSAFLPVEPGMRHVSGAVRSFSSSAFSSALSDVSLATRSSMRAAFSSD
ncbi:MAG: hypothetical protein IT374_15825 [Polyangiaceae bacterium]|nr:hypothetical protein [Polyangiaceae bacterium]